MAARVNHNERTLVVATNNAGKLHELSDILPASIELRSLRDFDVASPDETGRTFLDNAVLKAENASELTGLAALADDSGLEVWALGGKPGVRSARYAGSTATDADNNWKLISALKAQGIEPWNARFVCAVALRTPEGHQLTAMGYLHGVIVEDARGANGFGYDPHFQLDDPDTMQLNGKTLAELSTAVKNGISHRRRAYDSLLDEVRSTASGDFMTTFLLGDD